MILKPETLIDWQRRRFKKHWAKISSKNKKYGRKITKKEISQSTVSRYLRRFRSNNPDNRKRQSWITFLKNHCHAISAMDLFVVPTVNFTIVYVIFIIAHAKRKITFQYNRTSHEQWVMQQLKNAFPFDSAPRYLIFDRAKIFSAQVKQLIKNMNLEPKLVSYKAPWQNSIAE